MYSGGIVPHLIKRLTELVLCPVRFAGALLGTEKNNGMIF